MDWKKQKIGTSKKLRVIGSLLILIAFAVQTFLYTNWNDKIKAFEQANRDYSEMTRTSLLYQNLYFNFNLEDSIGGEQYKSLLLQTAAEKYRIGKTISTNLDVFKNESQVKSFVENSNKLMESIKYVNDFPSLTQFVAEAEKLIPENRKLKFEWMTKMESKKKWASRIFIFFQILGSLLFAIGIRYQ